MSKITLPPLSAEPVAWMLSPNTVTTKRGLASKFPLFTAEQLQADRLMVAEHVIRACAEVLRKRARKQLTLARNLALEDGADALLALLPESKE